MINSDRSFDTGRISMESSNQINVRRRQRSRDERHLGYAHFSPIAVETAAFMSMKSTTIPDHYRWIAHGSVVRVVLPLRRTRISLLIAYRQSNEPTSYRIPRPFVGDPVYELLEMPIEGWVREHCGDRDRKCR